MKVKVYVNWENQQVLGEKEFDELIADKIKNKIDDDYELNNFLEWEKSYTLSEVFDFTEADKKMIMEEFRKYCEEGAEEEILNDGEWNEKIIEV